LKNSIATKSIDFIIINLLPLLFKLHTISGVIICPSLLSVHIAKKWHYTMKLTQNEEKMVGYLSGIVDIV